MKEDPSVKLSFSLPKSLADAMAQRMAELGVRKTSAFIQSLIEKEAQRMGESFTLEVKGSRSADRSSIALAAESPEPYGRKRHTA